MKFPSVLDTFQRADQASINTSPAESGHPWIGSGTNLPIIKGNLLTCAQPGIAGGGNYAYIDALKSPSEFGCVFSLLGTVSNGTGITLIASNLDNSLNNMLHFLITAIGYSCQIRVNGEAPPWATPPGGAGNFASPLLGDGTQYSTSIKIRNNTTIVSLPDGSVITLTDTRINKTTGRYLCFQPNGGNGLAISRFHSVFANLGSRVLL